MILYDKSIDMRFMDYGILIPVLDSRAEHILSFLKRAGSEYTCLDYKEAAARLGKPPSELMITKKDLLRVHDASFIEGLFSGTKEKNNQLEAALLKTFELMDDQGNFRRYAPEKAQRSLTELFDTILLQLTGTYLAGKLALQQATEKSKDPAFCYFLGGGMHHARYDHGAGFCLVNDIMTASARLLAEQEAALIWLIDVDAHKGDGSAELAAFARQGHEPSAAIKKGEPEILTLSIHMGKSWPMDTETLAAASPGRAPLLHSDVEIPVYPGEEALYTRKLQEGLHRLETLSSGVKPNLIYVIDGADPYAKDGLDSTRDLNLSLEQCLERDLAIFSYTKQRRIPSAWLLAGGYGEQAWVPPAHFLSKVSLT